MNWRFYQKIGFYKQINPFLQNEYILLDCSMIYYKSEYYNYYV